MLGPVVVAGEPTDLKPCLRHFTYEEIALSASGARAHAALPEHGSNAIHPMLGWATRVIDSTLAEKWPRPRVAQPTHDPWWRHHVRHRRGAHRRGRRPPAARRRRGARAQHRRANRSGDDGRPPGLHSDAVALHARGLAPVVCGPGDLAVANTIDENIPLDELDRAAVLYAAISTAAGCATQR